MDFTTYQMSAGATDRMGGDQKRGQVTALLGLAGEAADLLSGYKKYLRDDDDSQLHPDFVTEELGDTLWYLSACATRFGLNLDHIAQRNLEKARGRFLRAKPSAQAFFDDAYAPKERLPREFLVEFAETTEDARPVVTITSSGKPLGKPITDNSYDEDGYRFHDVFHLAYAAHLAWSPVTRYFFQCKRKSDPKVDEIEDGGRAIAIEEGISAFLFGIAKENNFFEGARKIDYWVLQAVQRMASPFEVNVRTDKDWENAILAGYNVFRQLRQHRGGQVKANLHDRSIEYVSNLTLWQG